MNPHILYIQNALLYILKQLFHIVKKLHAKISAKEGGIFKAKNTLIELSLFLACMLLFRPIEKVYYIKILFWYINKVLLYSKNLYFSRITTFAGKTKIVL
ncbi:hypothetical protein DCO46_21520 [Flavobacterium sp. HTF]|nr:hypothetical protein DCO46_21520 [Flavobacterium sp. HTF]